MTKNTTDWRIIGVDSVEAVVTDAYGPVARIFHADRSKAQFVGNYKIIAAAPALADAASAVAKNLNDLLVEPHWGFAPDDKTRTDLASFRDCLNAALRAAGRL